ncbi:hypothetical protein CC1G_08564 [Coprinopsis cinerea okayama7|uniref:Uncharacterized protein n=1 Tax=Coprinopsis cinerea (strain Okayama-7 / 130 / ATCC MYA-4618 / FGSC 9003) TaxID=240176 RepID=A8NCS2_COPC7|nr:hypothetical protein CC1G_08564 [Coprinopsis cinerea okayama7\|eukprot:XP_001832614.2 hypothetical protein CC1G_08564 [Coprinopsis cinerea okayama7\
MATNDDTATRVVVLSAEREWRFECSRLTETVAPVIARNSLPGAHLNFQLPRPVRHDAHQFRQPRMEGQPNAPVGSTTNDSATDRCSRLGFGEGCMAGRGLYGANSGFRTQVGRAKRLPEQLEQHGKAAVYMERMSSDLCPPKSMSINVIFFGEQPLKPVQRHIKDDIAPYHYGGKLASLDGQGPRAHAHWPGTGIPTSHPRSWLSP